MSNTDAQKTTDTGSTADGRVSSGTLLADECEAMVQARIRLAMRDELNRRYEIERERNRAIGRDIGKMLTGWMPWF